MKYSQSIKEISAAFNLAQKELKNIAQTKENPFYHSSYAPLNKIIDEVKPILNKNGISILQDISSIDNMMIVSTILLHTSGEWIQQDGMALPLEKQTGQAAGIAVTYGRRYSLSALLGISSEDDNDGNISNDESTITKHFGKQDEEQHIEGEQFTIGQEVPKAYWNLSPDQKKKYMPKGCKATKIDNIWKVVPIGEV
jgi:hypothetical protein